MQSAKSLPSLLSVACTDRYVTSEPARVQEPSSRCSGDFCTTRLGSLPEIFSLFSIEFENVDVEQDGHRYPICNRDVLLARCADTKSLKSFDTKKRLQMADERLRTSFGQKKPCEYYKQVFVCVHCHRIYSALGEFRLNGFCTNASRVRRGHKKRMPTQMTVLSSLTESEPTSLSNGDLTSKEADAKDVIQKTGGWMQKPLPVDRTRVDEKRKDREEDCNEELSSLVTTIHELQEQLHAAIDPQDAVKALETSQQRVANDFEKERQLLRQKLKSHMKASENAQTELESAKKTIQLLTAENSHTKQLLDETEANVYNLERSAIESKAQHSALQQELMDALEQIESTRIASKRDVEATQKQSRHTIEYLQAQMTLEIECKQELGARVAALTVALEDQKIAKRVAVNAQKDAASQQLERLQASFQHEREHSTSQLTCLQSKNDALCARITQLTEELCIVKQKELQGSQWIEESRTENGKLHAHVHELLSLVESLEQENVSLSTEYKRLQNDTQFRRFENERQYLQQQYDHQTSRKEEAEASVLEIQTQLTLQKEKYVKLQTAFECAILDGKKVEEALEKRFQHIAAGLKSENRILQQDIHSMEKTIDTLTKESSERLDAVEGLESQLHTLQFALHNARKALQCEKAHFCASKERLQTSLNAMKASIDAVQKKEQTNAQRLHDTFAMEKEEWMQHIHQTLSKV